jgi:cytosine/adenosine deaminase-related metal-dependent hydrolase
VVIPGLVNTHHHFYQTLTRAMAQDSELFGWLVELYPIWAGLTPEAVVVSTRLALVELALSGCTTAFDHHYLWPPGTRLDDQFEGAEPVGIRFHAARGSMSLGVSQGGLPPDHVVESEPAILADSVRVVESFHQAAPGAMRRVVLAPCSPFSVTDRRCPAVSPWQDPQACSSDACGVPRLPFTLASWQVAHSCTSTFTSGFVSVETSAGV